MLSQQRTSAKPREEGVVRVAANAIPEDAILDAAYALVLGIGVRRVSMADLARHAGVSRTTLYRRWSSMTEVLASLFTRELGGLVEEVGITAASDRDGFVRGVVAFVRELRVHPLVRKVIEVDPEFLVPYTFERSGTSISMILAALEAELRRGVAKGWVRPDQPRPDARMLARAVLLSCWSFVTTAPTVLSPRRYAALDRELAELLDRYLR